MEIKLFGKYDFNVIVTDESLKNYICITPVIVPHTCARFKKKYGKEKVNIVERLINNLMRTEKSTGKKHKMYNVVKKAFDEIEKTISKNPLQVFVDAIQNAAPIEDITKLIYAGVTVPKGVDIAPLRRLDLALRHIALGALEKSFKNPVKLSKCLADEIIATASGKESYSIAKKHEIERIAISAI